MNKTRNPLFNKFIIILISACVILSCCSAEVSAEQLTGTSNDGYKKILEEKYALNIIIDESVKNIKSKGGFYKSPITIIDVELKILKDIDSAFSMLPDGFVKEINSYFKKKGFDPTIYIVYGKFIEGADAAGKFYWEDISIRIVGGGNSLVVNLLHEFGHEIQCYLMHKNLSDNVEKYFIEQNKSSKYKYNENYDILDRKELNANFFDYYLSRYASKNFMEDFAELFAYSVMQPRYISSYGNGAAKPVHNKIKKVSQVLCDEFNSLKNSKFLLNCLPDIPAKWADTSVKKAKEKEIIPWNIYGLNSSEVTKYDAALLLQPFLYKYIDEDTLLKKANVKKDAFIPENFVYDLLNGEDIWLLHHLSVMQTEKGRFNPNHKIQRQSAAVILAKVAQLFGLTNKSKNEPKFSDISKINESAKQSVKFVVAMGIMGIDDKNNFNPEKNITYQEFYNYLLNISVLKDNYNIENKIKMPEEYYKNISVTAISESGWIYYYSVYIDENYYLYNLSAPNIGGFTGKGRVNQANGGYFEGYWKNGEFTNGKYKFVWKNYWQEGEWKNGNWNGKGKQVWNNGSWFEGEWKEGCFINGLCKQIFSDGSWFEGEYKNGIPWNGKGISVQSGRSYEFKYINGEVKR